MMNCAEGLVPPPHTPTAGRTAPVCGRHTYAVHSLEFADNVRVPEPVTCEKRLATLATPLSTKRLAAQVKRARPPATAPDTQTERHADTAPDCEVRLTGRARSFSYTTTALVQPTSTRTGSLLSNRHREDRPRRARVNL